MVIKVGINSFGRIGRVIFRTCCENSQIEVAAINDPAIDLGYMCYLIKFDSTHGKYTGSVSYEGNDIKVNDCLVKVFHHKAPADIPWHEAGVQYVVEASGMFTSVEKASGHLNSDGVRRVIVTAPSADGAMLILGVNEEAIQPGKISYKNTGSSYYLLNDLNFPVACDMKVVSCASSTLYCLAPIVKVLEDAFGVADGFVTSIHAMTPSLKPLDGLCVRGKHWRDHRSIHQNIIPASTGACRALGRIIPACKDKLAGLAFRVPVVSVSVLDMCVRLNKNTTIDEITQIIEKLKNTALGNIIQVSNEKTVSSDFIGETHSCILDIDSSLQIKPNFFKLICWYENEYSYSRRVVDTVIFSERQFQAQISPRTRVMHMRPISFDSNSNPRHTEDIPAHVRKRLSFCVPNLKDSRSNMKSCSRSFIMRPSVANESPKYQHGQSIDFEKKAQSIKSYIDRFTKCNCKENTHILETRKDPTELKEHEKRERCLKRVEKEISEMLNMTENLLNKSSNRKLQSVNQGSKKGTLEFSEQRNLMRKNIIAKISDTLEKIRKEKTSSQRIEISGDNKDLILDVDDYQDQVSLSPCADSLNNSHLQLPMYNSTTQIINNVISSTVSVEKSNSWLYWDSCSPKINTNTSLKETNKSYVTNERKIYTDNKTNIGESKIEYVESLSLDDRLRTSIYEVNDTKSEIRDDLENEIELWNVTPEDSPEVNHTFPKKRDEQSGSNHHSNKQNNKFVKSITDIGPKVRFASKENKKELEVVEAVSVNTLPETENDKDDIRDELVDDKAPENTQTLPGCSSSTIENVSQSLSGIISNYTVTSANKKNGPEVNHTFPKKRDEQSGSNHHSNKQNNKFVESITDIGPKVRFASKENKKELEVVEAVSVNTLPETENDKDDIRDELVDGKAPENTQTLPGCSSSTIENVSQSLSGIISNYTVTSANKMNGPYVEDIYDKLDSESLSDSDSSFRIREKTSQVIRITDLTYSLEDLPRLDKICRVIEISDELSDKLFSPLDNEDYKNTAGRTWSFQDLCERIKFDEFCNELFEKPAS